MSDFTLNLTVKPEDLTYIRAAQQRITLAKPVSTSDPNVVWLSIDPFQSTAIEWSEEYWIYASTAQISEGNKITKLSEVTPGPAQDRGIYSFSSAATFGPWQQDSTIPNGTFAAQNDMPSTSYPVLTYGLSQSAQVNNVPATRKPISANSVLATQQIKMTPFTNVFIWLQSNFASETIITSISGNVSKAKFGGGVNQISLEYNALAGMFMPADAGDDFEGDDLVEIRRELIL